MGFPFLETSCSAVCRYETVITIIFFYIWHSNKTRFIRFFSVTLQSLIFLGRGGADEIGLNPLKRLFFNGFSLNPLKCGLFLVKPLKSPPSSSYN